MKKLFLGMLVGLSLVGLVGCGSSESSKEEGKTETKQEQPVKVEKKEYTKITARALIEEFDKNKVDADDKYQDMNLEVSGKLGTINEGAITITYEDNWTITSVRCKVEKDQVKGLKEGQKVTVKGTYTGLGIFDDIEIEDCEIVK